MIYVFPYVSLGHSCIFLFFFLNSFCWLFIFLPYKTCIHTQTFSFTNMRFCCLVFHRPFVFQFCTLHPLCETLIKSLFILNTLIIFTKEFSLFWFTNILVCFFTYGSLSILSLTKIFFCHLPPSTQPMPIFSLIQFFDGPLKPLSKFATTLLVFLIISFLQKHLHYDEFHLNPIYLILPDLYPLLLISSQPLNSLLTCFTILPSCSLLNLPILPNIFSYQNCILTDNYTHNHNYGTSTTTSTQPQLNFFLFSSSHYLNNNTQIAFTVTGLFHPTTSLEPYELFCSRPLYFCTFSSLTSSMLWSFCHNYLAATYNQQITINTLTYQISLDLSSFMSAILHIHMSSSVPPMISSSLRYESSHHMTLPILTNIFPAQDFSLF